MRYPKSIKKGDTLGIIAPSYGGSSSPFKERLDASIENLKKAGYKVEPGPNAYAGKGLGKSNTPQACAAEIMDFFTVRNVDAIISAGGGETMCEDLRYVDFERLAAASPKWFSGFSDNTNLTFTLATQCDTASIYGPNAAHFWAKPLSMRSGDEAETGAQKGGSPVLTDEDFRSANFGRPQRETLEIMSGARNIVRSHDFWEKEPLGGDEIFPTANLAEPFSMKVSLPGETGGAGAIINDRDDRDAGVDDLCPEGKNVRFEGRLIGGCLDCLQVLAGTPYAGTEKFIKRYGNEGIIWFFEACDLNPMGIRRAIWQLRENGWFEGVKGFLVGRPLHYGEDFLGMNQYNAVTGVLSEFNVPILMDLDIGHTDQMMPLVTGSHAVVETKGNSLSIRQDLV